MARNTRSLLAAAALALTLPLMACNESQGRTSVRDEQAAMSRQAAEQIRFNGNAERDNIRRRLELTANPTLLGYIVLFNEAGQPILYEGVMGKVTTSGSRLTPPDRINIRAGGQSADSQAVVRAPSDTGTYDTGNSSFIYYWNPDGAYRQWQGPYLYSDQPIRLRVEPLVVSMTTPGQGAAR